MTKRKEQRYVKKMQQNENEISPERNRTVIKMLGIKNQPWGIYKYVFTEKVKVIGKKYYDISDLEDLDKLGNMQMKEYIKNNYTTKYGKIPVLIIDYGETKHVIVSGKKGSLAPICCSKKDFNEIKVGDEIIAYGLKFLSYDMTIISLFIENLWE